jgi:receptor protein-tyrosine kinase
MITSPVPQDGKSTIVSNLGHGMAQAGHRTLIIDADMRAPVQQKLFGFDEEGGNGDAAGLSTVLAGHSDFEKALHATDTEGLSVLPCGPPPPNPAELLNTQAFHDLLEKAGGEHDVVLIDMPPVLPVADSRIVAPYCDAVMLVLRMESSNRKALQQAARALAGVGAPLIGVVANVVQAGTRYGSYGGYGSYGYGGHYHHRYYGHREEYSDKGKRKRRSKSASSETEAPQGTGASEGSSEA